VTLANNHIVFLLASEFSLFRTFFARNWPLLSPAHGFVTLALAMVVLGINMLGNLNKEAVSQESLGLAFWRVVISAGIIIFIMGWINLVAVRNTPSFPKTIADHSSRATSFATAVKVSQPVKFVHTVQSLYTSHLCSKARTALLPHPSWHNRTSITPPLRQNPATLSASSHPTAVNRCYRPTTLALPLPSSRHRTQHTAILRLFLRPANTHARPTVRRRRSGLSESPVAKVSDRSSQST
jgi:hypothetical protein